MKNINVVLLIVGLMVTSSCFAGTVIGKRSCEDWSKHRTKKDAPVMFLQVWLSGFMSGLSESSTDEADPLKDVNSPEEIYAWMDSYCFKNKDSDISRGGETFSLEMYAKRIEGKR